METERIEIWSSSGTESGRHRCDRFEAAVYARAAGGRAGGDVHVLTGDDACRLRAVLVDVMGHGPRIAALGRWMTGRVHDALAEDDDGDVLGRLNAQVCDRGADAMSTAVVVGLDARAGVLSYAYAGHQPILFHRDDAMGWRVLWNVDRRVPSFLPLGARRDTRYRTRRAPLRRGDRLVVLTDGLIETPGRGDDVFGLDRVRAFLQDHRHLGVEALVGGLVRTIRGFARCELEHDDVTLMAIEVR